MAPSDDPAEHEPKALVPVRSSDLPLLYILVFLHAAVLVALPVAAWFIGRFLGTYSGLQKRNLLLALLVVAAALVEAGLLWRLRKVVRRIREADLPPDMPGGSDNPG